jgi:hypothetical protein
MIFENIVPQLIKMLGNLNVLLDKAAAYADHKKFETEVLLHARLAPDQFNALRQIQITCDTAKLGLSRLTGKTAPTHDDKEKTLAEVKARIESTVQYLKTFTAKDFTGVETKLMTTPRWEGKNMTGIDFANTHLIPNFYFHLTTTYAILRHNGVDVGKKDYLGDLPFQK